MGHFLDHPAGWMPSRLAEIYDETSFWSARFGALLFDHLEVHRGIRGLDVGCGTGFPLFELAHVHGTSSHFIGVDIWVDALERARVKLELHGLTNVDIIEADVASLPSRTANTSAAATVNVRPDLTTRPRATSFSPTAGAKSFSV
jgi:ubiquinone/menaquinone biosynthesis C-methylase UbiE